MNKKTEATVSLALGILLKEKGFNYEAEYYHIPNPATPEEDSVLVYKNFSLGEDLPTVEVQYRKSTFKEELYPAPTYGLVAKWFREQKETDVDINWTADGYVYHIWSHLTPESTKEQDIFPYYEDCLEKVFKDLLNCL